MKNLGVVLFAMVVVLGSVTTSRAATFVSVSYRQNEDEVARMIYTGSGHGREYYWKLLGRPPGRAYKVTFKPDQAGGKSATLSGNVSVSIEIRNRIGMGAVKIKQLKLVRDSANSTRWYIPAKELKRIMALLEKDTSEKDPEEEKGSEREDAKEGSVVIEPEPGDDQASQAE